MGGRRGREKGEGGREERVRRIREDGREKDAK